VLEGASTHAYKLLGGPEPVPRSYPTRIKWLIDADAIPADDEERWDAARQLRNSASHRSEHVAMTPGGALSMVESVADDIDSLFTRVRGLTEPQTEAPVIAPTGPWWVPGAPATFATSREQAWKDTMHAHVAPAAATTPQTGLAIEFAIPQARHTAHAQDLDNLAEPALSTVVNRQGWFGKSRSNLRWLALRKTHASTHGCRITPLHEPPAWLPTQTPILDELYHGPRPTSAASVELPAWIAERCTPSDTSARYALRLRFPDSPNLGDIATGIVKPIIDCLWPQLGGTPASPEDWRLDTLLLVRACENTPTGSIAISLWLT
jgi:hypothetical protein